jgi:hypothetical protein
MHFFGENEGAAVITGPSPEGGSFEEVPEVYRENATDPDDAQRKLDKWRSERGWPA